uniref:Uncharacterized protein n=1 Tax=Rhizophora mucronata TaxID=61149 RepID=A0A2P2JP70_RHIMU
MFLLSCLLCFLPASNC